MPQPQHQPIGRQQPRPEQQRAFLPRPQRGELIRSRQRAVGVMQDVGDREVVVKGRPEQGKGRDRNRKEARDAGTPRRLREPLGRDAPSSIGRELTEGDRSRHKRIAAQDEGKQKGEAS